MIKRWEYKLIDSKDVGEGFFKGPDRSNVERYLDNLGRDGWELVAIDFLELQKRHSFVAVAKRPLDGD